MVRDRPLHRKLFVYACEAGLAGLCVFLAIRLDALQTSLRAKLKIRAPATEAVVRQPDTASLIAQAIADLKCRVDRKALAGFERALSLDPSSIDAAWGAAEVYRRMRRYPESERRIADVLARAPGHIPSRITHAYILYKQDRLGEASLVIQEVLKEPALDRENRALAYVILGTIHSRKAKTGGLFSKFSSGTKIIPFFLKAKESAPELPEVQLALGTFYLLAPQVIGGSLGKAEEALRKAVALAPEFATANARLAHYYRIRGESEQYRVYLHKARTLDPLNEVVEELGQEKE
jgi:Tfp pilus assembly protein PilF